MKSEVEDQAEIRIGFCRIDPMFPKNKVPLGL